jgi:hypothetical protein
VGVIELDAEALACSVEHAQAIGHDFLAGAVARDDGDME